MRVEPVPEIRLSPSPAVESYLTDFARVASAYEYDWTRPDSFVRRAAFLDGGGYRGDRQAVVAALERYNRVLGADEATMANIRLLAREDCLAVVAGQQPGIFTGPGFSVYKAMTAIRLARRESERLGRPVVPVFWIAAEDHDWYEVSWVLGPSPEGTVRWAIRDSIERDRRSVGLAPMPSSVSDLIEEFIAALPETEFKAQVAEGIREAAAAPPALDPGLTDGRPTLADWFARLMAWMFRGTGLIFLNASDPALRRLEADFFVRVIEGQEQASAALETGRSRWQDLGYSPTVDWLPESLYLFTYVDGERLPLLARGDRCWVRDREQLHWSRSELIRMAAEHPERFSTNVVTRPVVQGVLLPDLAVVTGPGEISYFGLLRDLYRALGGQMPVVYPRESFTLIEPPIARVMEKHGLALTDVFYHLEERKQELLEREDRLGITRLFQEFRESFGRQYDALVAQVLKLDPHLKQVTEENRRQIAVQINKLEEKARQQHRKNCEVALRQFERLKATLTPGGGLQERSVSVLPYLAKYGLDLVPRLMAATDLPEGWVHKAVFLGG